MATAQLTCRIRVLKAENNNHEEHIVEPQEHTVCSLQDCSDVGIEIRTQWAHEVMKLFSEQHDHIRPWDLLAGLDGSVTPLTVPASVGEVYPARFQIPLSTINELDHDQKVKRAEMFAMASLLYEIISGTQPFEELADDEVQHRFSNGEFPDDAASLSCSLFIYSGWSEEFSEKLAVQGMLFTR